jgi:hypothetical protein
VAGDFVNDFGINPTRQTIEDLPPWERPAMLDRAALTFCLADVFHPGCEITWPIRHISMFSAPFRIRHQAPGMPDKNYGTTLTPEVAIGVDGPLHAQSPGGLTRWMAVPWQADTASCQGGYDRQYDPSSPTFWAARVPNQVLTEADYRVAINGKLSPQTRISAFNRRSEWMRNLSGDWKTSMNQMVASFGAMGVVETRVNATGGGLLPPVMLVESNPGRIAPSPAAPGLAMVPSGAPAATGAAPTGRRRSPIPLDKVRRIRTFACEG